MTTDPLIRFQMAPERPPEKVRKQIQPEKFELKKFLRKILKQFLTVLVVFIAIVVTWFLNFPSPPMSPMLYQWESMGKQMKYKDYDIFYIDITTNSTNNMTLLYLHGFPTSSYDMKTIYFDLQKNFQRIVALDFIGFGFSAKPRFYTYSIFDQANLVEKLLKDINVDSLHILSHDYGDTVAQELLHRYSEKKLDFKIDSVCMMNGGVFPSQHRPILMQKLLRMPFVGTILQKFSNYYFFSMSFSGVFGSVKPTDHDLNDFWRLIRINDGYRVWGSLLSYIDDRFENEERFVSSIRHSPAPLHFIYGPADPVNPPPFDQLYRQMVIKPSIDVLPDTVGHYPLLEAPVETVKSYFNFLKQNHFLSD